MVAKPSLWRFVFLASCFLIMATLFQSELSAQGYSYSVYMPAIITTEGSDQPLPPFECDQNGLLFELWSDIGGSFVSDLTDNENYPHAPVSSQILFNFETPSNIADFYGTRLRTYLLPPVTGEYTFWIASDDEGILFLSNNDNPINMRIVAHVPEWTPAREWFWFAEQESAPIFLEAGRKYYVEVLHKEFDNGENLAVAWRRPDSVLYRRGYEVASLSKDQSTPQIITNPYLCAVTQIDHPPQAGFIANIYSGDAPLAVDFDASGSFDVDGFITAYDWRFGDGGEASGEFTSYIFSEPGNHQVQLFATDDDGNVSGSTIQYVTVFGDSFTRADWTAAMVNCAWRQHPRLLYTCF